MEYACGLAHHPAPYSVCRLHAASCSAPDAAGCHTLRRPIVVSVPPGQAGSKPRGVQDQLLWSWHVDAGLPEYCQANGKGKRFPTCQKAAREGSQTVVPKMGVGAYAHDTMR